MTMRDGVCECCNQKKDLAGVAAVPGLAISIAWCRECVTAKVVPYWAAVDNTAVMGGLFNAGEPWRAVVARTLTYFKIDARQFSADVASTIRELDHL